MGTLRSTTDWSGMTVNGCFLAEPASDEQGYVWDHPWLPDGHINDLGEVVPDGPTEDQ